MRGRIAIWVGLAVLALAAPAAAQLPLPPLPPVGPPGGPPPENPPPQQQPPAAQPIGSPPDGSVTVGVNPAHTGFVDDPNLVPPLRRRWTRTFSEAVGPVLASEGRLFTITGGSALRALDPVTGHDLWTQPVTQGAFLAYGGGRVFVLQHDGLLRAFTATDGTPMWQQKLGEYAEASPVAAGGAVYVSIENFVVAVDAGSGDVIWKTRSNGTDNVPAVDDDRVYVAYACAIVRAFDRRDGHQLWEHPSDCSGGGGSVPALYGSGVWVPDPVKGSLVLSRDGGEQIGSFYGAVTPAFAGETGVFRSRDATKGVDMRVGKAIWTFKGLRGEEFASFLGSPLIDYHATYRFTTDDRLYALSLETGEVVWQTKFGNPVSESGVSPLAVAPGLLLVPRGERLVAFESVYRPKPDGIAIALARNVLVYGKRTVAAGLLGRNLRGPHARVRLVWDLAPFGRFKKDKPGPPYADGFFTYNMHPARNLRFRFSSGGHASAVRRIWVYPRVKYHFKRPLPNRIRATLTFRNARSIHLGGRPAALYLVRTKRRSFTLLAGARTVQRGRGFAAATFFFNAIRHVHKHDYLAVCVRGQTRLGLGRPDRFFRHCGRRRITY
jgi:outer membrane protein assembly factor BamB